MLRYAEFKIVFREVPDEISLAYSISGCGRHCPGCHSPWLQDETSGRLLTVDVLNRHIDDNPGISCVALLGGVWSEQMRELVDCAKQRGLKTCWYTGEDDSIIEKVTAIRPLNLDYIKTGAYIERLGGLESRTTNQRFYRLICEGENIKKEDLTYRFRF